MQFLRLERGGDCVWEYFTWECEGVRITDSTPCRDTCLPGYILAAGLCHEEAATWQCGVSRQPHSQATHPQPQYQCPATLGTEG